MHKFGMSSLAGLVMMGAMACNNGVADTAQNATICERICKQVGECLHNTDTTACRQDCVTKSKGTDFENMASDCNDCVDNGDKCVNKALECSTECAGVAAIAATDQK